MIQKKLANYLVGLQPKDVSAESVEKIKYLLLDAIGIAHYVSARTAWGKIIDEYASGQGGDGNATLIGSSGKVHPSVAGFANGTHMLGCEMEDTLTQAYLHLGPPTLAAALAVGEQYSLSGESFITAVYGAYEITAPIGEIVGRQMLLKGAHPTSHLGCLAAAGAAGKLLNLSVDQMENALGIALMMSGGYMQSINEGSMTRRLYGGFPTHVGITAAELARLGFDGPHHALEGDGGLLRTLFADQGIELDGIVKGLGKQNQVYSASFKRHACCHAFHACIDILLDRQARSAVDPGAIKKIVAEIKLISRSHANKRPATMAAAQYSLPYCIATSLVRRQVGPEEFSATDLSDPEILRLAQLVETGFPEELQSQAGFPGRITIYFKDGTSFSGSLMAAHGDVQNEHTYQIVDEKFDTLTSHILSEDERTAIRARCKQLDQLEHVGEIFPVA